MNNSNALVFITDPTNDGITVLPKMPGMAKYFHSRKITKYQHRDLFSSTNFGMTPRLE